MAYKNCYLYNDLSPPIICVAMENETVKPREEDQLGFVKELARIVYAFGHDEGVFRKKVFEIMHIDSLKEKEIVRIGKNALNDDLRSALEDKKLSKKEVELCCLIEQGFSADEIAAILGLKNSRSVHVKQSRIKKKLKGGTLPGSAQPEAVLVMLIASLIAYIVLSLLKYPGF